VGRKYRNHRGPRPERMFHVKQQPVDVSRETHFCPKTSLVSTNWTSPAAHHCFSRSRCAAADSRRGENLDNSRQAASGCEMRLRGMIQARPVMIGSPRSAHRVRRNRWRTANMAGNRSQTEALTVISCSKPASEREIRQPRRTRRICERRRGAPKHPMALAAMASARNPIRPTSRFPGRRQVHHSCYE